MSFPHRESAVGGSAVGVYLHIPFCTRKCPYCDFYSIPFSDALADAYTAAVLRAVDSQPYGELCADTIYFGGGTPVLLGQNRLGRILSALIRAFGADAAEITLEANPASATAAQLRELCRLGFNRVSFGVQSLVDEELIALGRLHTAKEARQAILDAAEAGFENISADLMLAIPGQTADSLARSIRGLTALPIRHISAYLLKLEENTPLWAQKNALRLPDEDETAELYLQCVEALEAEGFAQYEISSFAREDARSRHNLNYWRCGEYLGIGPAAHSFLGGRRFFFPRDIDSFLAAEAPFDRTEDDGPGGDMEERLMLNLRLTDGFNIGLLPPKAAARLLEKTEPLAERGLIRLHGNSLSLTPEGFLLSNSVTAWLLEVIKLFCK